MPKSNSFLDVAIRTLKKAGKPLSADEIWSEAGKLGTLEGFTTNGKTPPASIASRCYTNMQEKGDNSLFYIASRNPTRFYLSELKDGLKAENRNTIATSVQKQTCDKWRERDLHPLLAAFVYGNSHFLARVKTIDHQRSSQTPKGKNKWLHPDLVGVHFPFQDYSEKILDTQKCFFEFPAKIFAFEMKISLGHGNLRESYFQAVSNSSWASEGYLVALTIHEKDDIYNEIRRLNNAFGIGVIRLDPENIAESEIMFPSRLDSKIDWDTANRLADENADFSGFLRAVTEDCKLGKIKSKYDPIPSDEELAKYIEEKTIH